MRRSKNGFLIEYDTTKGQVHEDIKRDKARELYRDGVSISEISRQLSIPRGSVYYIVKGAREITIKKLSSHMITRSQAKEEFEITDSQFDYARTRYPHFTDVIDGTVYLDRRYIQAFIEKNYGYILRYKKD